MTGNDRTQHLTDAEFADLLAGYTPGRATEAHLASCEHCRGELDMVLGSLGSFRLAGTLWAEAEAPKRVPLPSRLALKLGLQPSWSVALAATVTAGVLMFGLGTPSHHPRPNAMAHVALSTPSNAELAEDNRLMTSIDQELSYQASSNLAADTFGAAQPHAAQRSATTVTD